MPAMLPDMLQKNQAFVENGPLMRPFSCLEQGEFALKSCPCWGFPGGAVVKKPPANAGDTGLSPGLGRFPHAAE